MAEKEMTEQDFIDQLSKLKDSELEKLTADIKQPPSMFTPETSGEAKKEQTPKREEADPEPAAEAELSAPSDPLELILVELRELREDLMAVLNR